MTGVEHILDNVDVLFFIISNFDHPEDEVIRDLKNLFVLHV
jgi:hypothetical protein